jgi:Zn-dependent peptidase ImmA (M78 family)
MFLNQEKITEIEAKAITILENVFPNELSVPVDIDKVLSNYGITLKVGDFKDNNIAGAYDREKKTILISKTSTYQRNVFTVAHELGHYFLHKDLPNEIFYRLDADLINSPEKSLEEAEANWFAASILMPKSKVIEMYPLLKDLETMAKVFGVSKTAMNWRFKNLRLSKLG